MLSKKKSVSTDSDAYDNGTWANKLSVWAAVITTGGREFYAAQKVNEETTALFKVRFSSLINAKMRILMGARIYEILPPLNDVDNQHRELLISTKELI